ncbi:MAG: tRNA 2'-O-methylase [Promethearchaeota archaeon]|nr:MAG: tRNA 2'-O-methylase [Candidatus Lokiarchaeota archaeon]
MKGKRFFLPDKDFAIKLLKEVGVPYHVRKHSIKVAEKALEIAQKIKKVSVDAKLVEIGALFHDIGRSKTHGLEHGIMGAKLLKNRGFPRKVARICATHVLGGLDSKEIKKHMKGTDISNGNDFLPKTTEEKIVCLADKYLKGTKEVDLESRFNSWFHKYGRSELLLNSKKRVEKIQKELNSLM